MSSLSASLSYPYLSACPFYRMWSLIALLALIALASAEQVCTIKGASHVTPFGADPGDSYRMAMPCRYQLADFKVEVPGKQKICQPRIFAGGLRIGGQFYVNNFDVRLNIYETSNPNKLVDYIAVKAVGFKKGDGINVRTLVRHTMYDHGDKWEYSSDVSVLEQYFDTKDYSFTNDGETAFFHLGPCQIQIEFTHVKLDLSNSNSAGLVVKIPDDHLVSRYYHVPESACFKSCLSSEYMAQLIGANNPTEAMAYNVARHNRGNAGHPNVHKKGCKKMQAIFQSCSAEKSRTAIGQCMHILADPNHVEGSSDLKSTDIINEIVDCFTDHC